MRNLVKRFELSENLQRLACPTPYRFVGKVVLPCWVYIHQSYSRDKDRESATRFDRMLFINLLGAAVLGAIKVPALDG